MHISRVDLNLLVVLETIYAEGGITKAAEKSEVGSMLGISAGFYSAANAIAPLFYGSLFQWLGAPVPFFLGGVILAILWIFAPRAISKT